MGLDMYLSAKKYFYTDDETAKKISEVAKTGDFQVQEVSVRAMYWRKANAIHGWFVRNCQDDVDDCREYYVSHENLERLRDICQAVLDGDDEWSDELEPTEGFFFGSTEKDDFYYQDLKHTVEGLNKVLNELDSYDFYYQSSW